MLSWVVGIQTALLMALGGFLLNILQGHSADLRQMEIAMATMRQQLVYLEPLVQMIREEQMDRTKIFSTLREQLALLDQRVTAFGLRLDTQSLRLVALNERLDNLAQVEPSQRGFSP